MVRWFGSLGAPCDVTGRVMGSQLGRLPAAVHEMACGLYRIGLPDKDTMRRLTLMLNDG